MRIQRVKIILYPTDLALTSRISLYSEFNETFPKNPPIYPCINTLHCEIAHPSNQASGKTHDAFLDESMFFNLPVTFRLLPEITYLLADNFILVYVVNIHCIYSSNILIFQRSGLSIEF